MQFCYKVLLYLPDEFEKESHKEKRLQILFELVDVFV